MGTADTGNITLANAADAELDVNSKAFISGDVTISTDTGGTDGTIDFASICDNYVCEINISSKFHHNND